MHAMQCRVLVYVIEGMAQVGNSSFFLISYYEVMQHHLKYLVEYEKMETVDANYVKI